MFTHSRTRLALVAVLVTIAALLALVPSALAQSPTSETEVVGVIEAIEGGTTFTVNGVRVSAAGAEFYTAIRVGAVVKVEGVLQPDGTILAREVKGPQDDDLLPGEGEFTGVLTSLSSTSAVVNGIVFDITSAEIEPGLALGMVVQVHALLSDDGVWVAREIERDGSDFCKFEVETRSANLRSGPGTGYAVIGYASEDDAFHVLTSDASQTWLQVATRTGAVAWIALSVGELEDDCRELAVSGARFRGDDDDDDSDDDGDDDSGRSGDDDDGDDDSGRGGDDDDGDDDSGRSGDDHSDDGDDDSGHGGDDDSDDGDDD